MPAEPNGNHLYLTESPVSDRLIAIQRFVQSLAENHPLRNSFEQLQQKLIQYSPIGKELLLRFQGNSLEILDHSSVRELYDAFANLPPEVPEPSTFASIAKKALARVMARFTQSDDRISDAAIHTNELHHTLTIAQQNAISISSDIQLYTSSQVPRFIQQIALFKHTYEEYLEKIPDSAHLSAPNLINILLTFSPNSDDAWQGEIKAHAEMSIKLSREMASARKKSTVLHHQLYRTSLLNHYPKIDPSMKRPVRKKSRASIISEVDAYAWKKVSLQHRATWLCLDLISMINEIPASTDCYAPYPINRPISRVSDYPLR